VGNGLHGCNYSGSHKKLVFTKSPLSPFPYCTFKLMRVKSSIHSTDKGGHYEKLYSLWMSFPTRLIKIRGKNMNKNIQFCMIMGLLFFFSCATTLVYTHMNPLLSVEGPVVRASRAMRADFSEYGTFSVVPFSIDGDKMPEIMEEKLLFFLRNCFELVGYTFVKLADDPDFLVTGYVESEYRESYVPPSTYSMPRWVPGQTITSYGYLSGVYGQYSQAWGTYSGSTTTNTFIPGYMTMDTYTRPGYTTGMFYQTGAVRVYDSKTGKNIWSGSGASASKTGDPLIASQLLFVKMITEFPPKKTLKTDKSTIIIPAGDIGANYFLLSLDGNNFYPSVFHVYKNSPALNAGIKVFDFIISVDGQSLSNMSLRGARSKINGEPGSTGIFQVFRNGEIKTLKIPRVHYSRLWGPKNTSEEIKKNAYMMEATGVFLR